MQLDTFICSLQHTKLVMGEMQGGSLRMLRGAVQGPERAHHLILSLHYFTFIS